MNKKFLFTFLLILIFVSYIFNVDRIISHKISTLNVAIKENYIYSLRVVSEFVSKYFYQVEQIVQLKNDIEKLEQYKILYLSNEINQTKDNNNTLAKTKVISYAKFDDFSKVILNSTLNINKISALITKDGYSAGIIKKENTQYIGYLNHHPKSNYAVFIGENNVSGITHGIPQQEYIKIKFIPLWQDIKVGDKVITSGMDNIFPIGIKVGHIIKIKKLPTTQEALVKPYAKVYKQTYFYTFRQLIK